jgi:hypothetical protein
LHRVQPFALSADLRWIWLDPGRPNLAAEAIEQLLGGLAPMMPKAQPCPNNGTMYTIDYNGF